MIRERIEGRSGSGTRGRTRSRTLGLAATLGLVLPAAAACGIQPSGITALGPAPAAAEGSPVTALDTSAGATQYQLFYYLDNQLSPVYRPAAKGEVTEGMVLSALLAGPSAAEQAKGYTTQLSPKLTATTRANGLLSAYTVNMPLGERAKAQFICTMQYYDQSVSIGIQLLASNTMNWNACTDTTDVYIPMQDNPAIATSQDSND